MQAKPLAAVICLAALPLSSCLIHHRAITRQGQPGTRPLLNASREDLLARIHAVYDPVHSFNSTFDMTPALGSVYKGKITEFPAVRGYVLFRKPDEIRIIGLDPVIHSRAFDMVSTGPVFRLSIPAKNLFVEGQNSAPANSKNKLENLRPEAFLTAMLIYPPDPRTDVVLLEDDTDEEHAFYVLLILSEQKGQISLSRSIYFDRLTLDIVRQKAFGPQGGIVSDTRYSGWKIFSGGVPFPSTIDINRPEDGYGVVMTLIKMQMNVEVTADKFELTRPEGSRLQVIAGAQPARPATTGAGLQTQPSP